jgi:hypothetical protein
VNVVQVELRRFDLERVLFTEVAQIFDVGVAVQRVVVKIHLRVEREQIARRRDDERVDFQQRRVGRQVGVVERRHDLHELVDLNRVEADAERELARFERHDADARLDVDTHDLFRRLLGDLLDVHAAGSAGHDHRLARGAIEHDAQVQLARHLQTFFDEHAPDDAPFGAGLMRDERHADHRGRELDGILGALRQLDTAALAAAARVDLRLDDNHGAAQTAGDVVGFSRRGGDFAARHGDAVTRKNGLGLILVDFHDGRKLLMLTCGCS